MILRWGSLFSGFGFLDLALEWAGAGEVAWQVESEPFARAVLRARFPQADRSVQDVREVTRERLPPVDALCGGFPCQDLSYAGRGEGLDGARSGLWREYDRIIGEFAPRVVVVENSSALLTRGLDKVVGDLERRGYSVAARLLRASDVGAPHRRERIFLVAYSGHDRR